MLMIHRYYGIGTTSDKSFTNFQTIHYCQSFALNGGIPRLSISGEARSSEYNSPMSATTVRSLDWQARTGLLEEEKPNAIFAPIRGETCGLGAIKRFDPMLNLLYDIGFGSLKYLLQGIVLVELSVVFQ